MFAHKIRRTGFTLIELLLVVGILALLTAVILPKFDGLQSKVNHGIGAASADDTSRLIVTYKVTKNKYPDGWDSLMDASGTALWTAASPTAKGIHTQLTNAPIASTRGAKLSTTTLTAPELGSLQRMGITKVFGLTAGTIGLPGEAYTVSTPLATGSTVAILNSATPAQALLGETHGNAMIDSIYPQNTLSTGVSGAIPSTKKLVVFGFGPRNDLIGTSMQDCPFYPNVDLTLVYNRNLVVFEIDTAGGRADFKGVFGTDGDLKKDMANDMFK